MPHRLTKIRSHSFYRYFHRPKMLGWVELTGETEDSETQDRMTLKPDEEPGQQR